MDIETLGMLQLGGINKWGGCNSISFGVGLGNFFLLGERGLRIAGRWTEFLIFVRSVGFLGYA